MKKMLILVATAVLLVSACAGSSDQNASDTNDGVTSGGEVTGTTDTSGADQEVPPVESLPKDPGADGDGDPASSGLAEPGDPPPPADDTDSLVLGDGIPAAVEFAMADLAAHLGVSADVIDWVSYEEVDWPDGSLGCPQPDMSYKQVIVNGSLIVFEVDGVSYGYHAKLGSSSFLCPPGIINTEADDLLTLLPAPGDGLVLPKSPNTTLVVPPPRD